MEGKRQVKRKIVTYNLDVIISVGYRVKSQRGTQFRIWANKVLKDYLLRGYVMNQRVDRIEKKLIESAARAAGIRKRVYPTLCKAKEKKIKFETKINLKN